MKFIGYEIGQFSNPQGQQIRFGRAYFTSTGEKIKGVKSEFYKVYPDFIDGKEKEIPFGSEVEIYFDKYQKISHMVKK